MLKTRVVLGIGVLGILGSSGCRRGDDEIARSAQALIENSTFKVAVPKGIDFLQVAVGGTETVRLYDRAQVVTPSNGFAPVTNTGSLRSDFGVDSKTGNIDSVAPVFLYDRARVTGNVSSGGDITRYSGVVVTGQVRPRVVLTPPVEFSWTVPFPTSNQDVIAQANQTLNPAPGAYRNLIVYPSGKVGLRTGTYFVDQFDLENQGTLTLDTTAGPIFVYVRTSLVYRGITTGGSAESLLVAYRGSLPVTFTSSFKGTLIAPSAPVLFGATGTAHAGAAFAKSVSLDAGVRYTFRRFGHWDHLFPPQPLVKCVSKVGTDRFTALLGYDNPLKTVVQIPRGATNDMSGLLAGAPAGPLTTFQLGRDEQALWAPFSTQLTWTIHGKSVTATPASPSCTASVYPPGTPDPVLAGTRPEGPSFNMGNRPKPPAFKVPTGITSAQIAAAMGAVPLAATSGAAVNAPTFPFVFRITHGFVGDDGMFESPEMLANVTINGVNPGTKSLGPCDGTPPIGQGCIPPPSSGFVLNETFSVPISSSQQTVTVEIDLDDVDQFTSNDDVHNISLTVNNIDGTWTGTVSSPTNCSTNGGWGICWSVETTAPPPVSHDTSLCGFWNAHFVDEGFGETRTGELVPGQDFRAYKASHAAVAVHIRSSFVPDPTQTHVINATFDENGCLKVPARLLMHNPAATTIGDGFMAVALQQATFMATPSGITFPISDKITNADERVTFGTPNFGLTGMDATIDTSGWLDVGPWRVPPPKIELVGNRHTPMTTTAAAITSILTATDNGIIPGTYPVVINDGCTLKGQKDSCFTGAALLVGPAHTVKPDKPCANSSDCSSIQECMKDTEGCDGRTGCLCKWPHQARWKYIVAHEAGHQVQAAAAGSWSQTNYAFPCNGPNCPGMQSEYFPGRFIDPPWTTEMCGCQHVNAANGEHCLQSIERSGPAQGEGIAQFYASKVWNKADDPSCTFVYYKEFLDTTCHTADCVDFTTMTGQVLKSTLPPAPVSCRTPSRWRNKQGCNIAANSSGRAGDYGTEYDWMGFLYNQNTPANPLTPRTTMSDLWLIYRHACNPTPAGQTPPPCSNQTLVWNAQDTSEMGARGFLQGMERHFPGLDDRQRISNLANAFGVSADVTPP